MFCPECGQERTSQVTSFCSRCGFLLTGTAEMLRTGGAPLLPPEDAISPRRHGIRRGLFLFLLMFVVAPILGMISVFGLGLSEPWPMGIAIFLLGGGGMLRIAYALMFESKYPNALPASAGVATELPTLERIMPNVALPPQRGMPASEYTSPGRWLDTNDLEPISVTDNTTKLLEKDANR